MREKFFPENSKGLSAVVTTIILIALVMVAITIVWVTINNLISDRLGTTGSCLGVFEKVELNNQYTCYDSSSKKFQFSINIKDVEITQVIVYISGDGKTKSYTLTNEAQTIPGLGPYPDTSGTVILPEKNSGLTYISSEFLSTPDSIKISPSVDGNQCEVSDSIVEIPPCYSL